MHVNLHTRQRVNFERELLCLDNLTNLSFYPFLTFLKSFGILDINYYMQVNLHQLKSNVASK